jgi:V/A-type H+-transporting ATPase subunit E
MNLSELTDKIYAEGVEKGNAEAQQIVEKATEKAAAIVAEAEKKAAQIMEDAGARAQDLDKKTRAELKLYAEQSVNAVKTEITDLLADRIAS